MINYPDSPDRQPNAAPYINDYQLLHILGEGGSGTVFKAVQKRTGQTVALKLLHAEECGDHIKSERLEARFERETQLSAQLHHPHIVRLLDKGRTDTQQHYAVFEYVPGETLKELLIRKGSLSPLEAGDLMGQVLDALVCAHAEGIVHRDLKPQNIMITGTGTRLHVKILDFGIAALISERRKMDYRNLTMTAEMMCSPSYSAPEHLRGEPPTVKVDLYAWGLLFIECLTGRPAIEGSTLADIFHQQLSNSEVPLPPALLVHPLASLLRRVLRKNPQERAENAAALYHDFQKINLANIVGDLSSHRHRSTLNDGTQLEPKPDMASTQPYAPVGLVYQQQLSVFSCTLNVLALDGAETDIETLEAIQRDQLSSCTDMAIRYGGYLAGALGNNLLFYFGYPHSAEDDARRCARTALELSSQVRRRNGLLSAQGFQIDLRIAIHTGMVHILPGYLPTGLTPTTAMQLERQAEPGMVLASATSRQILAQYVEFADTGKRIEKNDGKLLPYFSMLGEYQAEAVFLMRSEHSMVGRETELSQLRQIWLEAQHGQGQALLLQGEAGIGKSRLIYEVCAEARQQGAVVMEVRCLLEYQNSALHPILSMLKKHLALQDNNPQEAVTRLQQALVRVGAKVEWVLPILCSWLTLPLPDQFPAYPFSAERQKKLLLDALQALILQFACQQPVLLLVEDMHWIDRTSQELLSQMLRAQEQSAKLSVLLLMCMRPGFSKPWPEVAEIVLERLSESATGQLVQALIGGHVIDPADLRRLCQRTDGIPLYVEELTRMLLDNQFLVERQGVYRLDARFDTSEASGIPVTLRDLLSARLACLGAAKQVAQVAAAIGREFDYALLLEVALIDEGTLQIDLEQLLSADLIYRQRRVQGDSYIFRHALIRDAAYDAMPIKIREQTHARIAWHMEHAGAAEIERNLAPLAQHFAYALEYTHAVSYGTRAAQIFLQRALAADAIRQCELVLAWTSKLAEPEPVPRAAQLRISRVLTTALMSNFGWADEQVKQQAEYELRLIDGSGDAQQVFPSLWGITFYHHTAGHRAMVRSLIGRLFTLATQSNDKGLLAVCNTLHGFALWIDGQYLQARVPLMQALQDYDALAHAEHVDHFGIDTQIMAMAVLCNVNWFVELDDTVSFELAHKMVTYARVRNHIPSLGIALMFQALNYQYANEVGKTLEVSNELLELSRQYSLPTLEGFISILYAWCTSDLAMADQVLLVLRERGYMLGLTHYASLAAEIQAREGNYAGAFERIQACLALAEQTGEAYYNPELLIRRAIYRAKTSFFDAQQSRDDLLAAIELAQYSGMQRCVQSASAQLRFFS
ncbi:TOMM system kinase/cyclase fusion protein [Iodobacter arcticus]|uniref:TOMM system kinase/cyclase fusion protein n=1 Tax=Iodobacter arcticus TaxID=590593 RepID=A0ABW2QVH9_9NEIS